MVMLNINMPASCDSCPFKGARLCYITVWLGTEYREVSEEGRAEWCPLIDLTQYEDDGKQASYFEAVTKYYEVGGMPITETAA